MKTLLTTVTLLLASSVVVANDSPVQQSPVQQAIPQQQAAATDGPLEMLPVPMLTPAQQQALIEQARRLAAEQSVPAQAVGTNEQDQRNMQRQR